MLSSAAHLNSLEQEKGWPKGEKFSPLGHARHAVGSPDVLYKDYPDGKYPGVDCRKRSDTCEEISPGCKPLMWS